MRPTAEIGVDFEGRMQPISALPEAIRTDLEATSSFNLRPGEPRKALHSEIVTDGWGTEISALYSEHGTNAVLPGGVYSLAPFRYYLEAGRAALESIHRKTGIEDLFLQLAAKLRQVNGVPSVMTHNGEQPAPDDHDTIELPGFSLLPLPLPEEWRLFCKVNAAAEKLTDTPGRDELRRRLLLCLLESGVPLKNICRYRRYYRFGSFIFINGVPAYFIALMRQSDCGLGLMPIRLRQPSFVSHLLTEIRRYFVPTPDRTIFGDFEFNSKTLGKFIKRLQGGHGGDETNISGYRVFDHGATFAGLLALGGFLTAGLRDELLLPANSYDIGDLLSALGIVRSSLTDLDGNPWRDPYAPTKTQRERNLGVNGILELLTGNLRQQKGKGRPRSLPGGFREIALRYKDWPDRTWAAFIAYFWPRPSKARIRKLLIQSGASNDTDAWAKAIRIFEYIRSSGRLASARPLRLVPPIRLREFLKAVESIHLPVIIRNPKKRRRALALIATIATLGCRPQEALRICKRDFTTAASFRLLRLHGTKVCRARREIPLHLFEGGPYGSEICEWWQTLFAGCLSDVASDSQPLLAGKREAVGRYEVVNDVLRTSFAAFSNTSTADPDNDGSFSAYSLRHAAAIRLVQAAIDGDFLHGNFQAALAEVAAALGHSYPVFLSCYLGTAALLLSWPTIRQQE